MVLQDFGILVFCRNTCILDAFIPNIHLCINYFHRKLSS